MNFFPDDTYARTWRVAEPEILLAQLTSASLRLLRECGEDDLDSLARHLVPRYGVDKARSAIEGFGATSYDRTAMDSSLASAGPFLDEMHILDQAWLALWRAQDDRWGDLGHRLGEASREVADAAGTSEHSRRESSTETSRTGSRNGSTCPCIIGRLPTGSPEPCAACLRALDDQGNEMWSPDQQGTTGFLAYLVFEHGPISLRDLAVVLQIPDAVAVEIPWRLFRVPMACGGLGECRSEDPIDEIWVLSPSPWRPEAMRLKPIS